MLYEDLSVCLHLPPSITGPLNAPAEDHICVDLFTLLPTHCTGSHDHDLVSRPTLPPPAPRPATHNAFNHFHPPPHTLSQRSVSLTPFMFPALSDKPWLLL